MSAQLDLVDIGGGNLASVRRCLERLNISYRLVGNDQIPDGNRPLVLPGVGAFGTVMSYLRINNFDQVIKKLACSGTPILGICVGMQILFDESEEAKDVRGLGLIAGKVLRFQKGKVPQIGWNLITPSNGSWNSGYVYFVNSFYGEPENKQDVLFSANYHENFCAAVKRGNITGFQFHPEKSGAFGERLLRRWLDDVC